MQGYFALATKILLIILVLSRVFMMKKLGIKAMKFGEMDKKDFLIPPFALLFLYIIFASAIGLPKPGHELYNNEVAGRIGVILCMLGLVLLLSSVICFGKSFRVGIDEDSPGAFITTGAFAISRNPIYTAFALVLLGIF